MALQLDIVARVKGRQSSGSAAEWRPEFDHFIQLTDGVTANKADRLFFDTKQLAASATEDFDLSGVADNVFQLNMVMAKIVGIAAYAYPANTNNLVIGNGSTARWQGPFGASTHTIAVPPGGLFMLFGPALAGIGAVTATTADILGLANSGAGSAIDFDLLIAGRSS